MIRLVIITLLISLASCVRPAFFKVVVVDEYHVPISNAEVIVAWTSTGLDLKPQSGYVRGVTDDKGEYDYRGLVKGGIGVKAKKKGFYRSWGGITKDSVVTIPLRKERDQENIQKYEFRAKIYNNKVRINFLNGKFSPTTKGENFDLLVEIEPISYKENGVPLVPRVLDAVFSGKADGFQPIFISRHVKPYSTGGNFPADAPLGGYVPSLRLANMDYKERYSGLRANMPDIWHWYSDYAFTHAASYRTWESEVNYFFKVSGRPDSSSPYYGIIKGPIEIERTYNSRNKKYKFYLTFDYTINTSGNTNI